MLALAGPLAARADAQFVRFSTTLGTIDVRLLPSDAPASVQNFLGYVGRQDYDNTVFHRSVQSGFYIVQGGGYRFASGSFPHITQDDPIALEAKVANARGTLAMARTNQPNTATSEWYFNVQDNPDFDGPSGYAVFGRVLDGGDQLVLDALAAVPTTASAQFDTLPVRNYSGGQVQSEHLVYVTSIREITDTTAPSIGITTPAGGQHFAQGQAVTSAYSCDDGEGLGVTACSGPRALDTSTPGTRTFTVNATDHAGNATSASVAYVVDPPPAPPPPTTTTTTAPAQGADAPLLQEPVPVLSGSPATSRKGVVSVRLRCTKSVGCYGSASLLAGKRRIGSRSYAIDGRRTVGLRIRLNPTGRRLLRRGRIAATLQVRPEGARKAAWAKRVTLRARG